MTNKVMLVDSQNFDLVQTTCSLEGYEVCTTSEDGALTEAISEHPDLILLDYNQGGLATCQALQDNTKTRDIPVVLLSFVAQDKESTMLAFKFGCIDFIQENGKVDELLSKLRTYLRLTKIRSISNKLSKIL